MVGATRRITSFCALIAAAGCLTAPPDPEESPPPTAVCTGDVGRPAGDATPWSIASLPAWSQQDAVAGDLEDWLIETDVFNHVLHGSIAAGADGQVTYLGGDLEGSAQSCAGVVAAHDLGYPILVVLGGDRGDDLLRQATDDDSRPLLVASLVEFIDRYGYDGASIAWITDVDPDQLTALVDDLSAAFATRQQPLLLTVDVSSRTVPPAASAGWVGKVDAINLMSYGQDWLEELDVHLEAGVPPELMNLGIGLVLRDTARANVAAKIDEALYHGLKGVESWELGALESGDDPRLLAYRPLID